MPLLIHNASLKPALEGKELRHRSDSVRTDNWRRRRGGGAVAGGAVGDHSNATCMCACVWVCVCVFLCVCVCVSVAVSVAAAQAVVATVAVAVKIVRFAGGSMSVCAQECSTRATQPRGRSAVAIGRHFWLALRCCCAPLLQHC